MTENTEFREELKRVVRTHDPNTEELRAAAEYLNQTAARWDAMEDDGF